MGSSVSDPKPIGCQTNAYLLQSPSGNLDEWENEGGSVSRLSTAQLSVNQHTLDPVSGIALLDALPLSILITNPDGIITYGNPASRKLHSASESELLGTPWYQAVDERDRAAIPAQWYEVIDGQAPVTFEVRMTTGSGERIWTRHSIARIVSESAAEGLIHTIEDITTIKASEQAVEAATEALSRERERARVTLECIGDAVISTDARGQVTYLNPVAEKLTGWSREAASGQSFSRVFRVVAADTGLAVHNPADRAMEGLGIVQMPPNCLLLRPDGSELAIEDSAAPIIDADGQLAGAVVIFRDQQMSRQSVARMTYLARHDALTGLPNRAAFSEHFDQAIQLARRHRKQVGLLFIDLDNFKQVNDSLGHKVGDRLLKGLSRRLTSCVRRTDLVCRHGGDEFVVLLSEISQSGDAGAVAAKMQTSAARPFQVHNRPVSLELSIGISIYPENGAGMESLIHRADAAMYHVKMGGGKGFSYYQAGMHRPIAGYRFDNEANVSERTDRLG
jgi:diguanylate cyclase (GGDEF)-like protein/PAS domain S-box-containing protein